jgi:hypothetical protein
MAFHHKDSSKQLVCKGSHKWKRAPSCVKVRRVTKLEQFDALKSKGERTIRDPGLE